MEDVASAEVTTKPVVKTDRMKLEAAERQVAMLLSVNRKLLTSVTEKERAVNQMKEENKALRVKMQCRGIEEPIRKNRIDELQLRLSTQQPQQADTARTSSRVTTLEEKIDALNKDNLKLSDTHRRDKKKVDEQQTKMKMLTKRTKELCKHIDFIATHLNEAQVALNKEAEQKGEKGSEYVDFRNLPGLHLAKLLLEGKLKAQSSKAALESTSPPTSP